MRYLIVFLIFMYSSMVHASGGMWPVPGKYYTPPSGDYSDITFYANTNSLSTTPQKGIGPLAISSGMLLNTATPIVGSGSWDNNNDGYEVVTIPVANINWDDSVVGLYFRPKENDLGRIIWDSNSNFQLGRAVSAGYITMTYKDKSGTTALEMTTDGSTAYFIEVKLTGTGAVLYINGAAKITLTGATGTITGNLKVGSSSGSVWSADYDQVIISNDTARSLFAVKDITDFN